ncbi:hypothetical protein BSPP4475_05935 [Brevibacillus aydinogluensis]|jgi:hypothetical protein|uniref:Uncharacterized protein n=1 Tax=Brevibacillus aydinogluensis TaxID=927786 RepID=A0AA48M5V7_9BACL|nr:hypothetical protein BSPP4475_05935 [Brevibacillus aydinogluensis]
MSLQNKSYGKMLDIFNTGKKYRRRDLHDMFGGQRYDGISTPSQYPFIMIFTGTEEKKMVYSSIRVKDKKGYAIHQGE